MAPANVSAAAPAKDGKSSAVKSSEGSVKVKKAQLSKAVRALQQLVQKKSANTNPLFGDTAETMTLLFSLSRIPDKKRIKPVLIPLPHPMFGEGSEVCMISKDPQKKYKELFLEKHPVPGLSKVISVEKLKKNYKTFDRKRALADSFDLFLCDSSVVEMMPHVLGSTFYEKKGKPPIPVRIAETDPKPAIQKAIGGTTLRVPQGPCLGVRFGRCTMSEDELVANAAVVIAHVAKHFKENPLQSINVQATSMPALPVWKRPFTPGKPLDMKKYASEAGSSSASDTGHASGTPSEAETGSQYITSASENEGALSELDAWSEVAIEEEDEEDEEEAAKAPVSKGDLPLVKGLASKKRKAAMLGKVAGTKKARK